MPGQLPCRGHLVTTPPRAAAAAPGGGLTGPAHSRARRPGGGRGSTPRGGPAAAHWSHGRPRSFGRGHAALSAGTRERQLAARYAASSTTAQAGGDWYDTFCDELLVGLGAGNTDDIAVLAVRPTPASADGGG
ncbi:hypothetical protein [Streptomyces spiralis]|uniref:hypothetical protein n=1 Tax=Streptomyces spiralis TaxID=66376 RepID=UPI00369B9F80